MTDSTACLDENTGEVENLQEGHWIHVELIESDNRKVFFRRVPIAQVFDEWQTACEYFSSTRQKVNHPAFRQLLARAGESVPFLLSTLTTSPSHAILVLHAITGEDPVPNDKKGDLPRMADAWIEWGKSKGILR